MILKPNNPLSLTFFNSIPKIELHAHLNGCVRLETLKEIASSKKITFDDNFLESKDLARAFQIFDLIHKSLIDLASIKRVAREMLEDFSNRNVIYIEIRTTPKSSKENEYTGKEYIETVLEEIIAFENKNGNNMEVRLLLSIDRSRSVEEANRTFELLQDLKRNERYEKYLIGLDYSGNPFKNTFLDFVEIFEKARSLNFQTAIHIAETEGEVCLKETNDILNFKPHRLGHFNFFNEELFEKTIKLRIPLEVCPTSNFFTVNMKEMKNHHFKKFFDLDYPLCICTDDTGVFNTDIANELYLIFKAFDLKIEDCFRYLRKSTECIINGKDREEALRKIDDYIKGYNNEF